MKESIMDVGRVLNVLISLDIAPLPYDHFRQLDVNSLTGRSEYLREYVRKYKVKYNSNEFSEREPNYKNIKEISE